MNTFSARYKGNRIIELLEDIDFPKDMEVLVVIPDRDDQMALRGELQSVAESSFEKLWGSKEDEVWDEYL